MKKIIPIIFVLTLCYACPNWTVYDVNFRNNTNFVLYDYVAFGYADNKCYPDTSIFFDSPNGHTQPNSYSITTLHRELVDIIRERIPSDTLSIFYFHPDTLQKYTWEEIRQGYKVLRRYDLSIEDIQKLKNKNGVPEIPYPPTEVMKDMKMYPPYKE